MKKKEQNSGLSAMYRRWIYMAIAIAAAAFLQTRPVFNFHEDKGIIYVRSFSMDQKTFYVTQTTLSDHVPEVTATMSVAGLYWCNKAMLWGAILCLLCFFSNRWRIRIATVTAVFAGLYYVLMVYYAMNISEDHYATLYPNWMVLVPAVVCQMMVLTARNVIKQVHEQADEALDEQPIEED